MYKQREVTKMDNGILIAFYSWKGNTRKIAEMIKSKTGGTLFDIKPVQPYTSDYSEVVKQAKQEIHSGFLPELQTLPAGNLYNTVFLGTPNWWSTMAPPLAGLISRLDLKGKTVIPFCTHGGGGAGTIERDIAAMCHGSDIKKGFSAYNDGGGNAAAEIESWLSSIGIS